MCDVSVHYCYELRGPLFIILHRPFVVVKSKFCPSATESDACSTTELGGRVVLGRTGQGSQVEATGSSLP